MGESEAFFLRFPFSGLTIMVSGPLPKKSIEVGNARIAYLEKGQDRPVVFLHGIPTSSFLWRGVMAGVSRRYRCLAPDLLGLGDTEVGLDQDYSMPAQAEMVAGFLERLGLSHAAIAAHDQGGACAQILAARYPDMVTHLVLVNSVAYNNWPVPGVKRLMWSLKNPGLVWALDLAFLVAPLQLGKCMLRKTVCNRAVLTDDVVREYMRPIGSSRLRRRRFRKFTLSSDCRYTQEVARDLEKFNRPTMIVWGKKDPFLPVIWAERLKGGIGGFRRLEMITAAGHFVPEEKPELLGNLILDFLASEG